MDANNVDAFGAAASTAVVIHPVSDDQKRIEQ
jgi:hypothetical protein